MSFNIAQTSICTSCLYAQRLSVCHDAKKVVVYLQISVNVSRKVKFVVVIMKSCVRMMRLTEKIFFGVFDVCVCEKIKKNRKII